MNENLSSEKIQRTSSLFFLTILSTFSNQTFCKLEMELGINYISVISLFNQISILLYKNRGAQALRALDLSHIVTRRWLLATAFAQFPNPPPFPNPP